MINIKCKIKNQIDVADYIRQFNNVKRFAYNRFLEKKSLSEVYHLSCKTLNNCELLDASFREAAVLKAKEIYDSS
jgi:predicted transposase